MGEGVRRVRARLGDAVHDPVAWNDVVQLAKTATAAVIAWVLAAEAFDLPQPFLAPWAALLVVHATVYRTFSRGMRQVVAAVVGVLLAAAVGQLLGLDTLAIAALLVVGLLVGSLKWFGAEATTIAATALIVLTTGYSDDAMLISRLFDTGIGVVVGLLVNVVVWPPLRQRTAITAMDRLDDAIGVLLQDIGRELGKGYEQEQVDDWIERTRTIDEDLDDAWALVRQARESARMNPRRSAGPVRDPQQWYGLLRRMEQAIAETRSMARTLGAQLRERSSTAQPWDPPFRIAWAVLLREAGAAASDADPDAIRDVRSRLERLVDELSAADGLTSQWPVHGALVINLRNILDAMDEVAVLNPLGQPPAVIDRLRRRPSPT